MPPEIRNLIYEEVARDSIVFVWDGTDSIEPNEHIDGVLQRNELPPFLLACKQTRQEYLPIMCAFAEIVVPVSDWNLSRVTKFEDRQSTLLYKALQENTNLTIALEASSRSTEGCKDRVLDWLRHCGEPWALQWDYQVGQSEQSRSEWKMKSIFLKKIGIRWLRTMRDHATENDKLELQALVEATEAEGDRVDRVLKDPATRRMKKALSRAYHRN